MKGTTMGPFLLALALTTASTGVWAQSTVTTQTMTCAQAKGAVATQGAVVLRTGPTTYDRYVRDNSFCAQQEIIELRWVGTSDATRCPIGGVCRPIDFDNGR
jgi:hypothetical protein